MKVLKEQKSYEIINNSGQTYIEDINVSVNQYNECLEIKEIQNALRVGKTCVDHSIYYRGISNGDGVCAFYNWMSQEGLESISDLLELCQSQELEPNRWGGTENKTIGNYGGVEIIYSRNEEKGVRVYSPFNTKFIKPLKEIPKKWKLTHVIKAILNGQFEDLEKNYYLTDDYAFDAAYNFQKGTLSDGQAFIKKIIESPSGWWTSINENLSVSVCCHSFDSNSFILKIA